jgi:hypothetical protein
MNFEINREWLVAMALLFALAAWGYKSHQKTLMEQTREETRLSLDQIHKTRTLKALWDPKGLRKRLETLHKKFPASTVKKFELHQRKLTLTIAGLEGKQLNSLLNTLGRQPLQFLTLTVQKHRGREQYDMECQCKW